MRPMARSTPGWLAFSSRNHPIGREVTRAVLQAGAMFRTGHPGSGAPDPVPNPEADIYDLAHIVVMALGDVELWDLTATDLDIDS